MPKEFTRDYFVEQGRKGGMKTLKKHGKKHFKRISAKAKGVDKKNK